MKKLFIKNNAWVWLWVSLIIVIIDQISKYFLNHHLEFNQSIYLLPFLNLWLKYNPGAAFSFLGEANGWQVFLLSGVSAVIIVILFFWLGRTKRNDSLLALALSLIIGGAAGNLIDRVRLNYVIDFIDFHLRGWHFATFNLADSAICIGAFLLVIKILFAKKL